MLTADLLVARLKRKSVEPIYRDPEDGELLQRAGHIIECFKESVNLSRARGELKQVLHESLLSVSTDLRCDRGLVKLCEDRCQFQVQSEIAPIEIREMVFMAAVEARKTKSFDRQAILGTLTEQLSLSLDDLEGSLYADLKDNERLLKFRELSPSQLLHRYNLALAQAVLFRAMKLTIHVKEEGPPEYRRLFRSLKFHRLLYTVAGSMEEGFTIHLDGPMSLFTRSQQYGIRMAAFLPGLVLCKEWSLSAEILWDKTRSKTDKPRLFVMNHEMGFQSHARDVGIWLPEEIKRLADDWPKDNDWILTTETDVLPLGGEGVFIPDFAFRRKRRKTKVFLEILGFWNRSAVEKRLDLLRKFGPKNLIVAISKDLCVAKDGSIKAELDGLPGEVYVYRSFPVRRELLKRLDIIQPTKAKKKGTKPSKKAKTAKKTKG
jgi:uncharacterized protein